MQKKLVSVFSGRTCIPIVNNLLDKDSSRHKKQSLRHQVLTYQASEMNTLSAKHKITYVPLAMQKINSKMRSSIILQSALTTM